MQALANSLNADEIEAGMCFPSVKRVREVSTSVAAAGDGYCLVVWFE